MAQEIRVVDGVGDDNFPAVAVTDSNALKVDNSGVTQPVSGTVTANQGTPNSAANGWPSMITDGTNTAKVTSAGSNAAIMASLRSTAGVEPNVSNISGSNALGVYTGRNSFKVPTAITGNVTGGSTDEGCARGRITVQSDFSAVGTLTGTMTVQGSVSTTPGSTEWTDLGTIAVAASGTTLTTFSTHLFRNWRINFTGAAGSGTITNRVITAD
jgi:hypothetical protein